MAREKHVNATTEEAKAAIIENSVLGKSVPINPVGNATELKQRFVNPIVNDEGKDSAITEVDRVAAETEAALDEIDENLAAVAKSVSEIGGELEELDKEVGYSLSKLQKDVQDLDKNKVNKSGDTMNGPLTFESQSVPGKVEVSEQGVFVTNNGENGTAYADGAIVNQGKKIVIPLKDGTMALAEETVAYIRMRLSETDYKLYLTAHAANTGILSKDIVDLPLESMVVGGAYNDETKQIELTLPNGNIVSFPVDELVNGLISSSEKGAPNGVASLDADGKVPKEQLPDDIGGGGSLDPSVLAEYVKNTDYATNQKAGIVQAGGYQFGISAEGNGFLALVQATNGDIEVKTNSSKPITPKNLDYAIKVGVTTNTETLTDEEQTSACEWIGAVRKFDGAKETGDLRWSVYCQTLGEQVQYPLSSDPKEGAVAMYGSGASLTTSLVRNPNDCANKAYVDGLQKFTHYIRIGSTDPSNLINVSLMITNNDNTSFAIKEEDEDSYNFSSLAQAISDTANGAISANGIIKINGTLTHLVLRAIYSSGNPLQLETYSLDARSLEYIDISGTQYVIIDNVI